MIEDTSSVNLRPYMNLGDFRRTTQCLPDEAVLQLSTIESDPEGTDKDWRFTRDVATLTVNHYPNGIVEVIVTDTRGGGR